MQKLYNLYILYFFINIWYTRLKKNLKFYIGKDGGFFMAGSSYGKLFQITTWGESHGAALGVVVDGCPAGLPLSADDIQLFLDRRKPGRNKISTPRKEDDKVEILSGVFEGKTTGTPISLLVRNTSQRSSDYGEIANYYRPGHADYTFDKKYGFRDYRGGGRSSGRETIGRVAAGAIASKLLLMLGIRLTAYTRSIGPVTINDSRFDIQAILETPTCMPDRLASEKAEAYLDECMKAHDSAGGVIECRIDGCPAGIGEPVFDKLDAELSKAIMSVGAVKAVEIGDGISAAQHKGSENNDAFRMQDKEVIKSTNHAGGILGGISNGMPILFRAAFKPTPSISQPQQTVDFVRHTERDLTVHGRHDPCVVLRAVPVVEAAAAIAAADCLLEADGYRHC